LPQGRRGPDHPGHVLDAAARRGSAVRHPRRHRPEDAAGAAHPVGEDVGDRAAGVGGGARAQQPPGRHLGVRAAALVRETISTGPAHGGGDDLRRGAARVTHRAEPADVRAAAQAGAHAHVGEPVLDDTLELRGYELRVRGIDVERDYDEQVPETMADAHQLQQVFLNLVTNAEQAMERSERDKQCLIVRTRRTGDLIRIEVEDTGSGIPPNLLERIFNPFFTTKPTGSGTGLGLSISLGIVREHEGRIWAENAPHGGARFVIELPMVTPHGTGESLASPAVTSVTDRLHVLVVDDEASVRVALQRYLSSRGHEVETTASGKEALARMREDSFDAVIIDMRMPDVSGERLFGALRARDLSYAERVMCTRGQPVDG